MHYECPETVRLGVYQLLYHLRYFRMTQSIPEFLRFGYPANRGYIFNVATITP